MSNITALTMETLHSCLRLSLTSRKSSQPDPKPDIFASFSHSFDLVTEDRAQVGQERLPSSGEILSEEKQTDRTNIFFLIGITVKVEVSKVHHIESYPVPILPSLNTGGVHLSLHFPRAPSPKPSCHSIQTTFVFDCPSAWYEEGAALRETEQLRRALKTEWSSQRAGTQIWTSASMLHWSTRTKCLHSLTGSVKHP